MTRNKIRGTDKLSWEVTTKSVLSPSLKVDPFFTRIWRTGKQTGSKKNLRTTYYVFNRSTETYLGHFDGHSSSSTFLIYYIQCAKHAALYIHNNIRRFPEHGVEKSTDISLITQQ